MLNLRACQPMFLDLFQTWYVNRADSQDLFVKKFTVLAQVVYKIWPFQNCTLK